MRCNKHLTDHTSSVGVCASCLRERLIAVIAAQKQQDRRKSDQQHVSPYISHRKSDSAGGAWQTQCDHKRFFCTPQVGPTGLTARKEKKSSRGGRFSSILSGFFKSKSDPDPRVSDSCNSSPWFSAVITRKNQVRKNFSIENRNYGNRGMSPEKSPDEEDRHVGSSGYSSETPQSRRKNPAVRRSGEKIRAFCLSPLVRASPNLSWNQSGVTPEIVVPGDFRVTAKPQSSTQASFCKNRSRKIADFGRNGYNH